MITVDEMCIWLHFQMQTAAFYRGPSIDVDDPDLHVIVTGLSGAGFDTEGAIDRPGMQLRTIGAEGNLPDAEEFANDLDRLVTSGPFPLQIAGKRVLTIGRIGGAPAPLALDATNRSNYVCSYLIQQEA